MKKKLRIPCQIIFLIVFLTSVFFSLHNLFFAFDPLVGTVALLASHSVGINTLFALITIVVTLIWGRIWCSFICPMGTILDLLPAKKPKKLPSWLKYIKFVLLYAIIVGAIFGNLVLMTLDPFSILYKGLTLLPFTILLVLVCLGNLIHKRFWCANICPLGALFYLLCKVPLFKKTAQKSKCAQCAEKSGLNQERRTMITTMGAGVATFAVVKSVPFVTANVLPIKRDTTLPPNATAESLQTKCVRCGMCIKTCPNGILRPEYADGQVKGMWTPTRIGDCKIDCGECGRICPTGAIPKQKG